MADGRLGANRQRASHAEAERAAALDVLVVGDGPAGFAAAAACAAAGLRVGLVGDRLDEAWPANYGGWVDELAELGVGHLVRHSWRDATVIVRPPKERSLGRGYALIDGEGLKAHFAERLREAPRWAGRAATATHDATGTTVTLTDGRTLRARSVVDAGGHRPALARRAAGDPGFQTALGWLLEVESHPFGFETMRLMDFGDVPGADPRRPTFLYAMPFDDRHVFVEETTLCARPARPIDDHRPLLEARLAALGVRVKRVLETERCWIPMGVPLPPADQRVVPFGGAAGFVHPATGYQLATALRRAPALAAALAAHDDPRLAADAGHAAVWPADARRVWALLTFGMEVLLDLDLARTRAFFEGFFAVPRADWSAYLAGTATLPQVARTMTRVFGAVSPALKLRLMRHGLSGHGVGAVRGLVGG